MRILAVSILIAALFPGPLYCQSGTRSEQSARLLYERGRLEQARSNLPGAVELYRASLQENPDYYRPLIGLAESFFALEEYQEALVYLKQAQKYDRGNLELLVLEGRIAVALNEPQRARSLFESVLQKEKNNLEARFGLAELDIAEGRTRNAGQRYIETLKIRPESQKALLSLALLREAEGDQEAAEAYLELALKFHTYDPRVHFVAARFSMNKGELERAEKYLLTAVALDQEFTEALRLLAQVYLQQDRAQEAVELLRKILETHREMPLVWYTLGLAYERAGEAEQAIRSLAQTLRLRPDDEIARLALENIALEKLPIQDPLRARYAAYHTERGDLFKERNLLAKSLMEYRRALRLQPESKEARLLYADLYRLMGFPVKYQKELEVLRDLGYKDPIILDNIEIIESQSYENVSAKWGIDQYGLDKKRFSVALYHLAPGHRESHPQAGRVAAAYFVDLLLRYPGLELKESALNVGSFESAFREARRLKADYFLILRIEESERSFTTVLDQYLAATGKLLASFRVFRTGNDRVQDNFKVLADRFHQNLPLKGVLLERQFDRGLVDLGKIEGMAVGQELAVVKKGEVRLRGDAIGLSTDQEDVLGTFTVARLDENVCEGVLAKKSFFDLINPGDEVILPLEAGKKRETTPEQKDSGLLRRLLGLIGF